MNGVQAQGGPRNACTSVHALDKAPVESLGVPDKECLYGPCKRVFHPKRAWHAFCSDECRMKYHRSRRDTSRVIAEFEARLDKAESELAAIKKRLEIGVEISRVFDKIEFKEGT